MKQRKDSKRVLSQKQLEKIRIIVLRSVLVLICLIAFGKVITLLSIRLPEVNADSQQSIQTTSITSRDNLKTLKLRLNENEIIIQKGLGGKFKELHIIGYSTSNGQIVTSKEMDIELGRNLLRDLDRKQNDELVTYALELLKIWPDNMPFFVSMDKSSVITMLTDCRLQYQSRSVFDSNGASIFDIINSNEGTFKNSGEKETNELSSGIDQGLYFVSEDDIKTVRLHFNGKEIIFQKGYRNKEKVIRLIGHSINNGEIVLLNAGDRKILNSLSSKLDPDRTDEFVYYTFEILNSWPITMPLFVSMDDSKVVSTVSSCMAFYQSRSDFDSFKADRSFNKQIKPLALSSICSSIRSTIEGTRIISLTPTITYETFNCYVGNPPAGEPVIDCFTGNPINPLDGCFGRCGAGCANSFSINPVNLNFDKYTQACFNHDGCVDKYGLTDSRCNKQFIEVLDDVLIAPNCQPIIDSSSPMMSEVGKIISISGINLFTASTVRFNNSSSSAILLPKTSLGLRVVIPRNATTGPIALTSFGGNTISEQNFIVLPKITSLSASSNQVGATISISGSGFGQGTSVKINGADAANATVVSPNLIRAVIPPCATSGPVSVTTPEGNTATSSNNFTITPAIGSFLPTSGFVGIPIVIKGSGFTGATAIKFNTATTTSFTINSDCQITVTVPSGSTTGSLNVVRPSGTLIKTPGFIVKPSISSFTPDRETTGVSLTIMGEGFAGVTSVRFGAVAAVFTILSPTTIRTTVPSAALTDRISVTTPSGTATSNGIFTVLPKITSIPSTAGVGVPITILGSGFSQGTMVRFNGTPATNVTVVSPNSIRAVVPPCATSGPIRVTTPEGNTATSRDFAVTAGISDISPTSGTVGTTVIIRGSGFTVARSIKFNTATTTRFTIDSDCQITVTVPSGATTGRISVVLPSRVLISLTNFVVPQSILSFTPSSGPAGTSVTVTGEGFSGVTLVKFGAAAGNFFILSPTSIRVTVPLPAVTGPISVTTASGTTTSSDLFTVLPKVNSFSPPSGIIGALVTVTGSGFSQGTAVQFNGTGATSVTVSSATSISTKVPLGATTGRITVTTPEGNTSPPSSTDFIVLPGISGFSPTSGIVGTVVTILGNGFTGATALKFNTTSTTNFTTNSDSQITVAVPSGATTGRISVITPRGTGISTNNFTVATAGIQFSADSYSLDEDSGNATITVTCTGGSSGTVTVNYATSDGSATAGLDYTARSGTLTFAAGETNKAFSIPIIEDGQVEGSETINLSLSNPTGGAILRTPQVAVLHILDNDVVLPVINSFSPAGGLVGTMVTIFGTGFDGATTVMFNTTTATTFKIDSDNQITATVPLGATTGPISVTTPGGTAVSTNSFTVQTSTIQFSAESYSADEKSSNATITVTRTGSSSGTVKIDFATSDGSATDSSDYMASSGTLTFASGEITKTFTVPIIEDNILEGIETVNLSLSNPTGGAMLGSRNQAVLSIFDDVLVVIPYLSSGYRVRFAAFDGLQGFEQPTFDDSQFFSGSAGFGSCCSGCRTGCNGCPLDPTVSTIWPLQTDFLLRKTFTLPSNATEMKVSVAIDNDVQVFINGVDVSGGLKTAEGCAMRDQLVFSVPDNILNKSGNNLVAVRARDRGVVSYVDLEIKVRLVSQ
jgi:hypothetical protein